MHALRLENVLLCKPLSDLRARYANPIVRCAHESSRTHGNLAFGENILALRLENASLRESLSDLRAGYANPATHAAGVRRRVRFLVWDDRKRTGTSFEVPVLFLVTRTGIEPMFPA